MWDACTLPYPEPGDFAPMAAMASELSNAKNYFQWLEGSLPKLADKEIEIVWSTKRGGLFPEFVDEAKFLARWTDTFPDAPVTLDPDTSYYQMISRPSETLVNTIKHLGSTATG